MDIAEFKQLPLMGIVRGIDKVHLEPLLEEVIASGLPSIEITMNTPSAADLIAEAVKLSRGRIAIGAGTVLSFKDLETALSSGAGFIVMPVSIAGVTSYCNKKNIPVFPGALTPQEVFDAWQSGASMVKVFPSSLFGPKYFKELKGPFNDIEMMAVGGVRPDNISEYFASGASAVAFGGSVFKKEWLEKKDYTSIWKLVSEYVNEVKKVF